MAQKRFAKVFVLGTTYKIDSLYDYSVPEKLFDSAQPGRLAVVPFGGGNIPKTAVIVSLSESSDYPRTKPIIAVPETEFFVRPDILELCLFIKETCICTFSEALRAVMPTGIAVNVGERYELSGEKPTPDENQLNLPALSLLEFVGENGGATPTQLEEKLGKWAKTTAKVLVKLGYLEKKTDTFCHSNTKTSKHIRLLIDPSESARVLDEDKKLFTEKQHHALMTLMESGGMCSVDELAEYAGVGQSVISALVKKGAAEFVNLSEYRTPYKIEDFPPTEDFELSKGQNDALQKLLSLYLTHEPKAALLHGVTGSGKTNVILKLIDKVLCEGRQVIYLVPEIALTSQTIAIFAGRYRDRIAVLHSALSVGEKLDAWRAINKGDADIVIGTRSAIFAPLQRLGLVVIDEEQESSFKSDMTPKYHARDIARFRCAKTNSLMLLASATPSIESYYKAKQGKYTLVTMTERFGSAKLPEVLIHDLKPEPSYRRDGDDSVKGNMIGSVLDGEIKKNLMSGEQTVLFMNRRGYHSFVTCKSCGYVMKCPNCSVSMTYHKYARTRYRKNGEMMCHYCGYCADPVAVCPECSSEHIAYLGGGTQFLEENIENIYPYARILRMDADTTSGKLSHEDILGAFRDDKADILVGTQMVTKGHDFPNVTLVGVVLADSSLFMNDYRSNEKTFSLITQVLGRAGRGNKPGRAVIQTYVPDNQTLLLSAKQDYESFYNDEIKLRKAAVYPPFCDMVSFVFSGSEEDKVKNLAENFGTRLDFLAKTEFSSVRLIVFGPFEAVVYRINGKYRLRFIIKCRTDKLTRELLKKLYAEFSATDDGVTVSVDINPSSL